MLPFILQDIFFLMRQHVKIVYTSNLRMSSSRKHVRVSLIDFLKPSIRNSRTRFHCKTRASVCSKWLRRVMLHCRELLGIPSKICWLFYEGAYTCLLLVHLHPEFTWCTLWQPKYKGHVPGGSKSSPASQSKQATREPKSTPGLSYETVETQTEEGETSPSPSARWSLELSVS